MKYEFTSQQYTAFLNSVAATDPYSLYNTNMGSDARGGITRSGSWGSCTYSVKSNMGDKPVNDVSWCDAARVSNWLMNSGTSCYWDYATQSMMAPTSVTADGTGIGSAGSTGNFANYNFGADWNGLDGNVTTVGTTFLWYLRHERERV